MLFRNPNLVIESLEWDFSVVVNPFKNNWVKVINWIQRRILDSIDWTKGIEDLVRVTGNTQEEIEFVINMLWRKDIVNDSGSFCPEKWKDNPQTLNLWIHTTDRCNLRCAYCYIQTKETLSDMDDDTIKSLFEKIIQTVRLNRLRTVTLRLSGWEPTIMFDKWRILIEELEKQLWEFHCQLKVAYLSNGTLLSQNRIDYIKERKIWLWISLDWIDWFHDSTRFFNGWVGCFWVVKKRLDKLLENWVSPNIMTVISNWNLDWLVDLTKFIIERKLPFRYSFVQWEEIDNEKLLRIMKECYVLFEEVIEQWYPFTKLHKLCDLKFLDPYFQTCASGFSWAAIYTNGEVHFCHVKFWTDESIGSIDESDDLVSIIKRWRHYNWKLSEDCGNCNYKYVCSWWCPLDRKENKDPACDVYKELIPIVYRLMWKERLLQIRKQQAKN